MATSRALAYGAGVHARSAIEAAFDAQHKRVWALCYRMSGCAADADDLMQASFERALAHPPEDLSSDLSAWLTRVALNVCRDHLRRRKHRGYVGPWLPGPMDSRDLAELLPDDSTPEARYGQLESVSLAFLHALEVLTPQQRAVLILRDVLDCSVAQTAELLEVSEAVVKTTLHRARTALSAYDERRIAPSAERRAAMQRSLEAFLVHLGAQNVHALTLLLRDDVVLVNDGAGEYVAARKLVHGRDKVLLFLRKTLRASRGFHLCTLNDGTPSILVDMASGGARWPTRAVVWLELDEHGRITTICSSLASRKLARLPWQRLRFAPLGTIAQMLRSATLTPPPSAWTSALSVELLSRVRTRAERLVSRLPRPWRQLTERAVDAARTRRRPARPRRS